jgi:hypothetical protein
MLGDVLLDKLFYESKVIKFNSYDFEKMWSFDKLLFIKTFLYIRCYKSSQTYDINPVCNEILFIKIIKWMANSHPSDLILLFRKIVKYGTWKDLIHVMGTICEYDVIRLFKEQLENDIGNVKISNLAKWIPNENSYFDKKYKLFKKLAVIFGITNKELRKKYLVPLRKKLNITECLVSSRKWSIIDYMKLSSRTLKRHHSAFIKNDNFRYVNYLNIKTNTYDVWGKLPHTFNFYKNKIDKEVGCPLDVEIAIDISVGMKGFPILMSSCLTVDLGSTEWFPIFMDDLEFNNKKVFEKLTMKKVKLSHQPFHKKVDSIINYKGGFNEIEPFLRTKSSSKYKLIISSNCVDHNCLLSYSSTEQHIIFWYVTIGDININEYPNLTIIDGYNMKIYDALSHGIVPQKIKYKNNILFSI